jgi:antitoxin component of MazEF toxin-antitoxin module
MSKEKKPRTARTSRISIKNEIRQKQSQGKLAEMLSKINEQNIHEEIETSGPVGNEIW